MTNRTIQDTITHYHLTANKKLGQHFLTDASLLREIAKQARIQPAHHIVEIGPGPGGLTRALLQTDAASLSVCELDSRCIAALSDLAEQDARLQIIEADALSMMPSELAPKQPRIMVANLPYNVGTAIIVKWLECLLESPEQSWESITVMLQKEVVQRIVAEPGSSHYGRLSIICQWLCEVASIMDVAPQYFSPPPKVMSAVVRLEPKASRAFDAPLAALEQLLHATFSQRRKMLRRSLARLHPEPENWLNHADIDPTRRPETLTLEEIGRLLATKEISD